MMKRMVKKGLMALMLFAVALSAGSCRRAVEKAADKIRFLGVEKFERQGLTGAEVVVRIDNGSAYNLSLASAEIGIYYGDSRVGTVVLCDPVAVPRRTALSVRYTLEVADLRPPGALSAGPQGRAGDFGQVFVSCAVEGRGGPAPVKFSRERMPLSDFLNTFGLSIQDVEII